MNAAPAGRPLPVAALEEGLRACLRRPLRIAAVEARPLERSSHAIERLRVTLEGGESVPVLFKRLQPGQKAHGNEREVPIYRRLLAGRRFGAPALYTSLYDEEKGLYWLLLEDVGERTLETADVGEWLAAVRLLAGMHAAYQGREAELRALGCLGEHGADYYRGVARTARRHLELSGDRRALARLDRALVRFDGAVDSLVRQPRTLVHGDVYPDNFLIQPGRRVRLIDWEAAAVGVGAWDLTRLLDGWGSDRPAFVGAYWDELERRKATPSDRASFDEVLRCCAVFNCLWHPFWDAERCREPAFVEGLLSEMETALEAR